MEDPGAGAPVRALTMMWGHLPKPPTWRFAAVVTVVAVVLAIAGVRAHAWQAQRMILDADQAAVDAATVEVNGLIEVSPTTSAADFQRLLDGAASGFRGELHQQATVLSDALRRNHVTATGKVVSAGVVNLAGARATVVVAAAGSVSNKKTNGAEPRNYRLRVDLEEHGDRWLVSGLEFVS